MKIGALDFEEECRLLEKIRKRCPEGSTELRVDANGAFSPDDALLKLKELKRFALHSVEQPVKQGQWDLMEEVCARSPVAVALDEELIGIRHDHGDAEKCIRKIKPAYLVLKPNLLGGFEDTGKWIRLADKAAKGWWITSALESNIGLNAIAQYTAVQQVSIPQGLGTGTLYENNYEGPLTIKNGTLSYDVQKSWVPVLPPNE